MSAKVSGPATWTLGLPRGRVRNEGETMNLARPDRTFDDSSLPVRAELNQIKPGSFCRLQTKSGSRFWARVIGKKTDGTIHGLTEDIIKSIGMRKGQLVVFDRSQVFGVI